jgi:hypothetical protein
MHRQKNTALVRILVSLVAVVLAALGAIAFAQSSTAAAAGDSVTATNSHVNAQCSVNTVTVNSNGTTSYYISSQGIPTNLGGYLLNVYTEVDCTVQDLDAGGAVVGTFNRATNASVLLQARSSAIVLPPSHHYVVCAQGKLKLAQPGPDGLKQSWTPVSCTG